jgi:hypothetical protein
LDESEETGEEGNGLYTQEPGPCQTQFGIKLFDVFNEPQLENWVKCDVNTEKICQHERALSKKVLFPQHTHTNEEKWINKKNAETKTEIKDKI